MLALLRVAVVGFLIQYAACQPEFFDPFAEPEEILSESPTDPLDQLPGDELQADVVDNLLTNLETLATNVDKTAQDFANPLVQLEKELLAQIQKRNKDTKEELFVKLRNNYRNLRKRIGTEVKAPKVPEMKIDPAKIPEVKLDIPKLTEIKLPPLPTFPEVKLPEVPKIQEVKFPEDIAMSSSFFGMNLQNKGGRSSLDLSIPFLPMKLSISSKPKKLVRKPLDSAVEEITKRISEVPNKLETDSAPEGTIEEDAPRHPHSVHHKHHSKPASGVHKMNIQNFIRDQSPEPEPLTPRNSNQFSKRQGDASEENSEINGRILGEILYSEQMFDQMTRQVLKNHGKWALDSSVVPAKVKDTVNKVVNRVVARADRGKNPSMPIPTAERFDSSMHSHGRPPTQQKFFSQDRHTRPQDSFPVPGQDRHTRPQDSFPVPGQDRHTRPQDIFPVPGQDRHTRPQDLFPVSGHDYHQRGQGNILLAFTPEGVPLKLRIDVAIRNPLRYLQEVLSASAVSLYVPVESNVIPRPAGTDIMQLGYVNGMMRAVTVDLSDPHQLDSLVRQLRRYSNGFN